MTPVALFSMMTSTLGQHPVHQLLTFRRAEVGGEGSLVAVAAVEKAGFMSPPMTRRWKSGRRRRLDLDDVGAPLAEQATRFGCRDPAADLEYANSRER